MMQIYMIAGKLTVAKDAAEARIKTGVDYKASVMNLTHKLKALCEEVLGETVFAPDQAFYRQLTLQSGHTIYGTERAVNFVRDALDVTKQMDAEAVRREEDEHAHTRRLLDEQSAAYRALFDKHQTLSKELIYANGRISALTKEAADTIAGLQDLLAQARQGNDHLNERAEHAEAALRDAQDRIQRLEAQLKQTPILPPETTEAQEAPSTHPAGDALTAGREEAETPGLSALSQTHGKAVMQLLDLGHNPDEVVLEINKGLSRNAHITTGLVKKIKVEMTQHLRALNHATLKAKRA